MSDHTTLVDVTGDATVIVEDGDQVTIVYSGDLVSLTGAVIGPPGPTGPPGPQGPPGPAGSGALPVGGVIHQTLTKRSATDNDATWTDAGLNTYNVKHFGATGDGTSDDTAAVQAAVTAGADGRPVMFPPGTYRLSATIVVPTNASLIGWGATLVNNAPGTNDFLLSISGVSRVTISGLTIDGNKAGYPTVTEQRHGIFVVNSSDITLFDVTSRDNKGDGLYIGSSAAGPSRDITVTDCRFTGNHRNNSSVTRAQRVRFIGCSALNAAGTAPQCGFHVEVNTTTDELEDVQYFGCTADGNTGPGYMVILQSAPTVNQRDVGFYGCTAKSNGTYGWSIQNPVDVRIQGGGAYNNTLSGIQFAGGRNIRVDTNSAENGQYGLFHSGGITDPIIISGTYWHNSATTPNTYDGIMLAGSSPSRAFILPGTVSGGPTTGARQRWGLFCGSGITELIHDGVLYINNVTGTRNVSSASVIESNMAAWQTVAPLRMKQLGGSSPQVRLAIQTALATAGDLDYAYGVGIKAPASLGVTTVRGGVSSSVAMGVDTMVNGVDALLIRGTATPTAYAKLIDRFVEINEIGADAAAGAADTARLYAKDNGSAKTQLAVRFATGAVVILATEGISPPPTVVKTTTPTAADYGLAAIPTGAVWIQSP